jgi:hypothetical protein
VANGGHAQQSGQPGWVWYPGQQGRSEELSYKGAPSLNFGDDPECLPTQVRIPDSAPAPAPRQPQVVRMPPAIPANGPASAAPAGSVHDSAPVVASDNAQPVAASRRRPLVALPTPVPTPVPSSIDAVRSAPVAVSPVVDPSRPLAVAEGVAPVPPSYHWVESPVRQKKHTFEFSGSAAKLSEGKSMILGPMDFAPIEPATETVLESSDATWYLFAVALVFMAATVALMFSSEITVGVNTIWSSLAAVFSSVPHV